MGYDSEYQAIPITEDDVELRLGQQSFKRSIAGRPVRITLGIALAVALVSFFSSSPLAPQYAGVSQPPHRDDWFLPVDDGELVECYRKDADLELVRPDEPRAPHEPHERHECPMNFIPLPDFSLNASSIYFFAHDTTYGNITFDVAESDSDEIAVSAEIGYCRDLVADVCKFRRGDGALGVGVVLPPGSPHGPEYRAHEGLEDHIHHLESNYVKLVVKFPASATPFTMHSLETRLPLYSHTLGSLGDRVHFDRLDLRTANEPIRSESVTAARLAVRTSNANIDGTYNATDFLSIIAANAPINVTVSLETTAETGSNKPAILELVTSNGKLEAMISLTAAANAIPGEFTVRTITASAPLNVTFASAPPNSTLDYHGSTTNAPLNVTLHASYEGKLNVATVLLDASININNSTTDPANLNRTRSVFYKNVGLSMLEGEVYWGNKTTATPAGSVHVVTSLAFAGLSL